jgi:hypothetical protein
MVPFDSRRRCKCVRNTIHDTVRDSAILPRGKKCVPTTCNPTNTQGLFTKAEDSYDDLVVVLSRDR